VSLNPAEMQILPSWLLVVCACVRACASNCVWSRNLKNMTA
jgi:hypothetical protein